LCDYTNDKEKGNRIEVLDNTYQNGLNGGEIKGASQFLEIFTATHDEVDKDKESVANLVESICQILNCEDKDDNNNNGKRPTSITRILIQLAKENTLLFFKDQYDIAYAKVKVQQHSEIISLRSSKFEYFISKLYFDYTRDVVSQESLNNAIRVLIAQTSFENTSRELNLRFAWGEKDKEIFYDLADPNWQCIKITRQGWNIIQDSPVLFIRFNQRPQLESDRKYLQDIFDKFLDLMYISDRGHRLLTKVWIVSLLIPGFPHPINITFGEKGGSKSTFCRFVKRLVDPDNSKT
jgi:hypothetical protein